MTLTTMIVSSKGEETSTALENDQALSDSGTQQDVEAQRNGKEEAEPNQAVLTDAGTMTVHKAVLTQSVVLHLLPASILELKDDIC